MSFSKNLKEEISKIENLSNKEAIKYELKGYLISSNVSEEKGKLKFCTENEYNINRFARLLSNMGIDKYDIELQGRKYIINVKDKKIEETKNMTIENPSTEQIKYIIRGAYLGGGSINNPEKNTILNWE